MSLHDLAGNTMVLSEFAMSGSSGTCTRAALGDLVQLNVIGEDLARVTLGQSMSLRSTSRMEGIIFQYLDSSRLAIFCSARQHIEPRGRGYASGVRTVSHQLQSAKRIAGPEHAIHETGLGRYPDAAIDDHTGIPVFDAFLP